LSAALWRECGGYDESMLYMNSMEINMIDRLLQKFAIVNLGTMIDNDFYHLEHYHPFVPRRSGVYRKTNDVSSLKVVFQPNGEKWGLAQYSLCVDAYASPGVAAAPPREWSARDELTFSLFLLLVRTQIF